MLDCVAPLDETGRLLVGTALTGENPFVYGAAEPTKLLADTLDMPRW